MEQLCDVNSLRQRLAGVHCAASLHIWTLGCPGLPAARDPRPLPLGSPLMQPSAAAHGLCEVCT